MSLTAKITCVCLDQQRALLTIAALICAVMSFIYNPNSGNVGIFFKLSEMKTKRLSNNMRQYFIHSRTQITQQMLKWIHFTVLSTK